MSKQLLDEMAHAVVRLSALDNINASSILPHLEQESALQTKLREETARISAFNYESPYLKLVEQDSALRQNLLSRLGIASGYTAEIAKANDALRQTMFGTGSLVEELEKRFAFSTKPPSDLFPHLVSQHTAKLLGIQTAVVFEESFSGELLERLQRFKSVTSHVEQETILEEFFLWMVEKFSELLQTFYSLVVTRDIIVGTFLLFLSLILNRNSASKDDLFELAHHFKESLALVEQSSEKNTRLLEEASRELAELRSVTNFHRNYVVIKPVRLRTKPTNSLRVFQRPRAHSLRVAGSPALAWKAASLTTIISSSEVSILGWKAVAGALAPAQSQPTTKPN